MLRLRFDRWKLLRGLVLIPIVLAALSGLSRARAAVPHLAYGFNVAAQDYTLLYNMGFDWIKYYDVPPIDPPPSWSHVLLRLTVNAQSHSNLAAFLSDLDYILVYADHVDAYEIGNEVNLDANYGWNAPPNADRYKVVLCAAYDKIKQADPDAIVVSAGLAPTGRVTGNWNGHPGHNGAYQDEREFLKELLDAGGGSCLDAVGYHPYGFSADYDAVPDVPSTDSPRNCVNGFCFRGAEKIYEIMQAKGLADKKIWATEFGWITNPPDYCKNQGEWSGRLWQIVSEQKQASNLVGAFQYADANWPWMGGMFIFNLNFNTSPYYDECEQMRFYGVQDRPAEAALTNMPKYKADLSAKLKSVKSIDLLIQQTWQPITLTTSLNLTNSGWQSLIFTATADSSANVVPIDFDAMGTLSPTTQTNLPLIITSTDRSIGLYTGTLMVATSIGAPRTVTLNLRVADHVYQAYLPLISVNSTP